MEVDIVAIDLSNQVKGTNSFQKTEPVKPIVRAIKVQAEDSVLGQATNANKLLTTSKLPNENVQSANNLDKQDNTQQQDKKKNETSMMSASKDINKIINSNTVAEFGFFENTNKIIIKIKDINTNQVIKEIPSEKALELLQKALDIAGILVDEKR